MIGPKRPPSTADEYAQISNPIQRISVRLLDALDVVVYVLVGLAFIGAAMLALVFSVSTLLNSFGVPIDLGSFEKSVLGFVSNLLLVLIIVSEPTPERAGACANKP